MIDKYRLKGNALENDHIKGRIIYIFFVNFILF